MPTKQPTTGMEIAEPEVKKEPIDENEKVKNIVKKAKESGKMTYGELAKELEDTNPEQIYIRYSRCKEISLCF